MKKFFIGLGIVIALILVGGMLLPSDVIIERSGQVNAPANIVWSQVNNLKAWEAWDPWHAKEPEMGNSVYSGPKEGADAKHCWDSENPEIGKGCMTITQSEEGVFVNTDLSFGEEEPAAGGFKFNENEGITTVVWSMNMKLGSMPWDKLFGHLFVVGWVEKDFENGLAKLATVCEAIPVEVPKEYPIEISEVDVAEQLIYTITDSANTFEIGPKLGQMYGEIMAHMAATGGEATGQPFCIWHKYDPGGHNYLEAGVPCNETVEGTGRVKEGFIQAGKAVMGIHKGSYHSASISYQALEEYMADNGLHQDGPPWEVYVTDPIEVPDTAQWITHIFFRFTPQ